MPNGPKWTPNLRELRILSDALSEAKRSQRALGDGFDLAGLHGHERRSVRQSMQQAYAEANRYAALEALVDDEIAKRHQKSNVRAR